MKFQKILPYLHTYDFATSELTDQWVSIILDAWESNDKPYNLFIPEVNTIFGPIFLESFMEYYNYGQITDLNRILIHIQDKDHNNDGLNREWEGIEEEEGWNLTSIVYLTDIEEDLKLSLEFPNNSTAEVVIKKNTMYTIPSFVKYKLSNQTTSNRLLEMSWGVTLDSDLKHKITGDEW